jgi:hypothetical protein
VHVTTLVPLHPGQLTEKGPAVVPEHVMVNVPLV